MVGKDWWRIAPVIVIDSTCIRAANIGQVKLIEDDPLFLAIAIRILANDLLDTVLRWEYFEEVNNPATGHRHAHLQGRTLSAKVIH